MATAIAHDSALHATSSSTLGLSISLAQLRVVALAVVLVTAGLTRTAQALKGRANRQKTVAEQLRPNVSRRPLRREPVDRPARDKSKWQRRKTR